MGQGHRESLGAANAPSSSQRGIFQHNYAILRRVGDPLWVLRPMLK
jgi:hypothetical protein